MKGNFNTLSKNFLSAFPHFVSRSRALLLFAALVCGIISIKSATGGEPFGKHACCPRNFDPQQEKHDEAIDYGPRDGSPRKTLFQWSHRATFEGGPPSREESLVTDRPDFTEASTTVGRGVAQFEFGYTYTHDEDGTTQTSSHSSPEVLLRLGVLAEWLELRAAYNYGHANAISGVDPNTAIHGSEDLYLGMKLALTPQAGLLPEMALIPQMTVPSGDRDTTSGEVLPGVNWIYGWEINEFISTAGSSQYNRALDEATNAAYGEFAQSWTIAYTLTERLGAYTEWYALVPDGAETARTEHYFNGGFTFLVNNDLQLDLRAGGGASQAADDYFLGSGLSVRY